MTRRNAPHIWTLNHSATMHINVNIFVHAQIKSSQYLIYTTKIVNVYNHNAQIKRFQCLIYAMTILNCIQSKYSFDIISISKWFSNSTYVINEKILLKLYDRVHDVCNHST